MKRPWSILKVSIDDNVDKKIFVVPLTHTLKEDLEREVRILMIMTTFARKKQHSFFRQRSQSLDQPCKPYNMVDYITNIFIVITSIILM